MEEKNVNSNNNMELPMAWWKFLKYFRFPVSIIAISISLGQCIKANLNGLGWLGWTAVIIELVTLISVCTTYIMMLGKHKKWFNFFVLNLFIESVRMTFVTVLNTLNMSLENNYIYFNDYNEIVIFSILRFVFIGGIWIVPNYIYFKKRKAYFTRGEEIKQ